MTVTIITPTGGRSEAFALCEKYMARQTLKPDQWLVVDDYLPRTACTMGQEVIYPAHTWKEGDMTLTKNLLEALQKATGDYILIIEDDDWYSPKYIETMVSYLKEHDLVGEGRAKYYNIFNSRCMIHTNMEHASLCQTAFTKKLIPDIIKTVKDNITQKFIDIEIWKIDCKKIIFDGKNICVGIKGMPGRGGIGYGHKDKMGKPDTRRFHLLKQWIGSDTTNYEYSPCAQVS